MHFDIVVIGAGLAGASFVVALRASRARVAVIEGHAPRPPAAGWDSRIYAISPANKRFLDSLGLWQRLDAARITPVFDMEIHGDRGGRLDFSAYDAGVTELAWIVESSLMQGELWETMKRQANVTLLCPAQPRRLQLDEARARVALSDGRELTADLVVGADGVNSWVRETAGLSADVLPYRQKGVVANFACSRPHRNVAYQWFRPDGVLAYLPLPGERISIVWSTADDHADELAALPASELAARVAAGGEHRLGSLEQVTPATAFPLRLMRVERSVMARVALIGDAAHAIHPLSGHGINLGFQDARVLAEVMAALPTDRDFGAHNELRRYERARVEEVTALQMATHALQRLFQHDNTPLAWLRNAGLNLTNALPVVREALTRYALG